MSRAVRMLSLLGVLAGLMVGVSACSVFGERFEPQGQRATTAREAAVRAVEERLDELVVGAREHGRLRGDACREGQDNWKRTDALAWECRVGVAAVVDGASTREGVAAALTALHGRLMSSGCQPREGGGLLAVVRDYWLALQHRPGYGPEDLPPEVYTCADGIQVEVVSSAPDGPNLARDLEGPFGGGFDGELRVGAEPLHAEALASARSSAATQLFVVRVTERYYAIRN